TPPPGHPGGRGSIWASRLGVHLHGAALGASATTATRNRQGARDVSRVSLGARAACDRCHRPPPTVSRLMGAGAWGLGRKSCGPQALLRINVAGRENVAGAQYGRPTRVRVRDRIQRGPNVTRGTVNVKRRREGKKIPDHRRLKSGHDATAWVF